MVGDRPGRFCGGSGGDALYSVQVGAWGAPPGWCQCAIACYCGAAPGGAARVVRSFSDWHNGGSAGDSCRPPVFFLRVGLFFLSVGGQGTPRLGFSGRLVLRADGCPVDAVAVYFVVVPCF